MGKSAGEIEGGIRAALRVCSLEAVGLWCVMRYVIDDSDRPGHLRQNGRPLSAVQLAREAGCAADAVARLQQELADAGLIAVADRTWHSPHLARLAEVRSQTAARVQRLRARRATAAGGGAETAAPARRGKVRRSALRNAACNADVTPHVTPMPPAPSPGSPPTTPSPTPTPDPPSDPSDRPAAGGGTAGRRRAKRPPPDAPHPNLIRHFVDAWEAKYRKTYPFKGGRDGASARDILIACGGSETDAIAAADRFLAAGDPFLFGHRLSLLASQITRFMFDAPPGASGKQDGHANGHHRKPTAADRGEHPEPERDLPEFGKAG